MKFAEPIFQKLLPAVFAVFLLPIICGCGEDNGGKVTRVIDESGIISSTDLRDPDHSYLAYDAYEFVAGPLDLVSVEIEASGFSPLLKLVEISTGAVLEEWDPQYSSDDALNYTVAVQGSYEARVYALENGTGNYDIAVILKH